MNKYGFVLLVVTVLFVLTACTPGCDTTLAPAYACTPPSTCPDAHYLPIATVQREQGMWCWAAVGQMCMQYVGFSVTQCQEANAVLSHGDCCPEGSTPINVHTVLPVGCNYGGWPPFQTAALAGSVAVSSFPVTATQGRDHAYLSFCELKNQLGCLQKPVAFAWLFNGGTNSGHILVATGYYTGCDGKPYILINNPQPPDNSPPPGAPADYDPQEVISYDEFVSGSYFTHWRDYYDITKIPD